MGYSAEVLRRARARLAEAKADREAENSRNLERAYEQVPRIREIDRELRITMAQAAAAAVIWAAICASACGSCAVRSRRRS